MPPRPSSQHVDQERRRSQPTNSRLTPAVLAASTHDRSLACKGSDGQRPPGSRTGRHARPPRQLHLIDRSELQNLKRPELAPIKISSVKLVSDGSLLRVDPAQKPRLIEIRDNLVARITEAQQHGWVGEAENLAVSPGRPPKASSHSSTSAPARRPASTLGSLPTARSPAEPPHSPHDKGVPPEYGRNGPQAEIVASQRRWPGRGRRPPVVTHARVIRYAAVKMTARPPSQPMVDAASAAPPRAR